MVDPVVVELDVPVPVTACVSLVALIGTRDIIDEQVIVADEVVLPESSVTVMEVGTHCVIVVDE